MDVPNLPAAMMSSVRSGWVQAAVRVARRVCFFQILLLLPIAAISQVVGVVPMHGDHKAVLIAGYARGTTESASIISIAINGIEFVVNTIPSSGRSRHEIGSPMGACNALQEQISDFTLGIKSIPEFESACIALAGEAALLLVQANTKKYIIPSEQESDDEAERWIKAKRRFLFVSVNSTDPSQKVVVVK